MMNSVVMQTSQQVTARILCDKCEGLFGEREEYVSTLAFTGSRFGLLEALGIRGVPIPPATPARALNCEWLRFFALSVLWRGHAARARECRQVDLSAEQAERIRQYLVGDAAPPGDMFVLLWGIHDGDSDPQMHSTTVTFPVRLGGDGPPIYAFVICGLYFQVAVGDDQPAWAKRLCLQSSDAHVQIQPSQTIAALRNVTQQMLTGRRARKFRPHR